MVLLFKKQSSEPLPIDKILLQEHYVHALLKQELRGLNCKIEVIDDAISALGPLNPDEKQTEELAELRAPVTINKKETVINPADLQVLSETSLTHARGNLSYLQDLNLSEFSLYMKEEFAYLTKMYLSDRVLPYLEKPKGSELHTIKPDDPNLIRQIKKVENSLTKFNIAFVNFEQMNRNKSMVFQAQAFITLRQQVFQLVDTVLELPPDLKAHYGPLIDEISSFSKLLKIDYNKEDLAEFQALLQDTKKELLRKRKKGIKEAEPEDTASIPKNTHNAVARMIRHEQYKNSIKIKQHELEHQQTVVNKFFKLCAKYQLTEFSNISSTDLAELTQLFASIQIPLSQVNLGLANQLVLLLKQSYEPMDMDQILMQEKKVNDYLNQQLKDLNLKIEVLDKTMPAKGLVEPNAKQKAQLAKLRAPITTNLEKTDIKPADLQVLSETSLKPKPNILSNLQDIDVSGLSLAELENRIKKEAVVPEQKTQQPEQQVRASEAGFFKNVEDTVNQFGRKTAAEKARIEDEINRPRDEKDLRKRAAKLATKYVHLASPEIEKQRGKLKAQFSSIYGPESEKVGSLSREQLYDEEYMRREIARLNDVLNKKYEHNWTTFTALNLILYPLEWVWTQVEETADNIKTTKTILDQTLRVGAQLEEVGDNINTIITGEYIKLKDIAYEEILFRLSQRENDLGLKAGVLFKPAMATVNQFFLAVALELDMPFEKKIELFDEARFINLVLEKTQNELNELEKEYKTKPQDIDLPLRINLTKDKISFLKESLTLAQKQSNTIEVMDTLKSTLLDNQFEVNVRKQLKKTGLERPISDHYRYALYEKYKQNKASILALNNKEIDAKLNTLMQEFKEQSLADYLFVSKGHKMLEKLSNALPKRHIEVKNYLDGITDELMNEDTPIEKRAARIISLPDNKTFNRYVDSVDDVPDFIITLKRLYQLVERYVSSLYKYAFAGADFWQVYNQKKLNQTIENVEEIEKNYSNHPEVNKLESDTEKKEDQPSSEGTSKKM